MVSPWILLAPREVQRLHVLVEALQCHLPDGPGCGDAGFCIVDCGVLLRNIPADLLLGRHFTTGRRIAPRRSGSCWLSEGHEVGLHLRLRHRHHRGWTRRGSLGHFLQWGFQGCLPSQQAEVLLSAAHARRRPIKERSERVVRGCWHRPRLCYSVVGFFVFSFLARGGWSLILRVGFQLCPEPFEPHFDSVAKRLEHLLDVRCTNFQKKLLCEDRSFGGFWPLLFRRGL
mmetsp:Transcript_43971/g.121668  ORF Transcript_43971/g.121668 Transcript_43971/m.121668 type:complete len:229 (-) Transcript_43971:250-936(-)